MDKAAGKLCILFEEPFWIGVFERISDGKLSVAKVTFGAEPKDYEVYDFILNNYDRLQFSPDIDAMVRKVPKNPKRMQKDARKQIQNTGIGTKSQQALKLQQEERKAEHQTYHKEEKEIEKQRQFELKQQKKREKHRGR